jgi:hypothetical protein
MEIPPSIYIKAQVEFNTDIHKTTNVFVTCLEHWQKDKEEENQDNHTAYSGHQQV